MQCPEMERRILSYVCDELEEAERAAVAAHLDGCAACRSALEREQRLLEAMKADHAEPSPVLLASCRNELSDSLDLVAPNQTLWQRLIAILRPPRWLALHPAWSAAMFLVIGVVLGARLPQVLLPRPNVTTAGQPAMTISPASASLQSLRNLRDVSITGINSFPVDDSEMPTVEVHGFEQQPVVMQGTLNDGNVRRALTYVVQNNQRFDSGLRLESIELLRTHSRDTEVRAALCHAALKDRNPGVRLKALEALREMGEDPGVRQTMIDALLHDDNPGVRVEAITSLRALAEQGAGVDQSLLEVFRDRMQRDPSTFVRMQSAAAIRQMGQRAAY